MKRSLKPLVLGAAVALPLLGLTATTAEATVSNAPHRVTKNIHYKAHESGSRYVACPYPEIGTEPFDGTALYGFTSTGTAEVSVTPVGEGTISGILVTFDNTTGTKGGNIRAFVWCDED